MMDKKDKPTPRRSPLKETTIDWAMEIGFQAMLKRHLAEQSWDQVKEDFLWYGRFLETKHTVGR